MRHYLVMSVGFLCSVSLAVPPTPVADPSGIPKNRYISMSVPSNGGEVTALRVTLTSLHHPNPPYNQGTASDFSGFEGEYRWVGPPVFDTENDNDPTPFVAAPLQCTPHYADWGTLGLFHVYGDAVVPSSVYDIASLGQSCLGTEESCGDVSPGLQISTPRFGDMTAAFNPPASTAQPDTTDLMSPSPKLSRIISSNVKSKAALQLFGDVISPHRTVNVLDQIMSTDAFRGYGYPMSGPSSCEVTSNSAASPSEATETPATRSGATFKVFLTPVPARGALVYLPGTQIAGQDMSAPSGGFTAFLNMQMQDWNPGNSGPALRGFQIQVDAESLLGLNADPPAPGVDLSLASQFCTSSISCRTDFGESGVRCSSNQCEAVYVADNFNPNFPRPPWIFDGLSAIPDTAEDSPSGPIVIVAGIGPDEVPMDDGERKYVGTIVLDIPPEAAGHLHSKS